jgi:DNA-binding FrmR family transcriptional regulator
LKGKMGQLIEQYWAQLASLLGIVIWGIRLEGRTNAVEKTTDHNGEQITALNQRMNDVDSQVLAKLTKIIERLSFIEGKLEGYNEAKERLDSKTR